VNKIAKSSGKASIVVPRARGDRARNQFLCMHGIKTFLNM
jgi:hypothetical protein